MKTNLTTGPVGIGWLLSKLVERQQKRPALADADTIDNLALLHQLKEKGILTDEEFAALKKKLKARI